MTPGYTLHTAGGQPTATRGKWVKYRLFNSDRFGYGYADDLNWQIDGNQAPESGRIFEYKVLT